MNKRFFIPAIMASFIFSLTIAGSVLADTAPIPPSTAIEPVVAENNLKIQGTLYQVIRKGEDEIFDRLDLLSRMERNIQTSKLTSDQKTALDSLIEGQINGLKSLASKMVAETDLTAATADYDSIYADYRVYAVFVPEIHHLTNFDRLTDYMGGFKAVFAKAQARLDIAKAKGRKVAAQQRALSNAEALAPAIEGKIDDAYAKVAAMKPSDYPVLSRSAIISANFANKDIHRQINLLRALLKKTALK